MIKPAQKETIMKTLRQKRIPKSGSRFSDKMRDKITSETLNIRFDRGFHPIASTFGYLLLLAPVPLAILKLTMGV